jgi:uncharacterized protein (DUF3820 family)
MGNIIPFGKYKGRTIEEVLIDDPGYLQWCAGQDWFRARFNVLYQVIINRGAEPEETPEHNALQVRFLDDEFCRAFLRCYKPDIDEIAYAQLADRISRDRQERKRGIENRKRELENAERQLKEVETADGWDWLRQQRRDEYHKIKSELLKLLAKQLSADPVELSYRFTPTFEIQSIDVVLAVEARSAKHDVAIKLYSVFSPHSVITIEIKPIIGDDYPAVLRQMRASNSCALLVGDYTGVGATREQFIKTFASAGIKVVFVADIDATVGAPIGAT